MSIINEFSGWLVEGLKANFLTGDLGLWVTFPGANTLITTCVIASTLNSVVYFHVLFILRYFKKVDKHFKIYVLKLLIYLQKKA